MTVNAGSEQILRKSWRLLKLLSENRYTQHVVKWGPINTSIRRQITEFIRPADQAPWICVPLFSTAVFIQCYIFKQLYTICGYVFRLISETLKGLYTKGQNWRQYLLLRVDISKISFCFRYTCNIRLCYQLHYSRWRLHYKISSKWYITRQAMYV